MSHNYVISIALFFFSFALLASLLAISKIKKFGKKFNFLDKPNKRKIHTKPVVRIGGASIFFGFNFTFIIFFILDKYFNTFDYFNLFNDQLLLPFLLCSGLFFFVGLIDDIYNLSPYLRLFLQFLLSSFLWNSGLQIKVLDISWLNLSTQYIYLDGTLSLLLTIFWIVGVTNAINWFDGLDGLAAGVSVITSLGLIFICFSNQDYTYGFVSLIFAGSCLGFLLVNFFPASIHMGDSGSYFLGLQLSATTLIASRELIDSTDFEAIFKYNIFYAFLLLIIPLLDMIYVILRRILERKSPFFGDKRHLHHRLMNLGFSHRNTVFIIYFLTIIGVSYSSYIVLIN